MSSLELFSSNSIGIGSSLVIIMKMLKMDKIKSEIYNYGCNESMLVLT